MCVGVCVFLWGKVICFYRNKSPLFEDIINLMNASHPLLTEDQESFKDSLTTW